MILRIDLLLLQDLTTNPTKKSRPGTPSLHNNYTISLGFGLRLKRFSIEYAHARYTLAGSSNHFSVAVNL